MMYGLMGAQNVSVIPPLALVYLLLVDRRRGIEPGPISLLPLGKGRVRAKPSLRNTYAVPDGQTLISKPL